VRYLTASEAAERLGISVKALKLYEAGGLVVPERSAAGWRAYGPAQMCRASEVAALRALGFSLGEVVRVLTGDAAAMGPALAAHQTVLETRVAELMAALDKLRALRDEHAPSAEPALAFDLPWPWGGERFALDMIEPLTYITGPLGSGKTRFAIRLAEALPRALFIGLERETSLDALLARLDAAEGASALVVDLIEHGLDRAAQEKLAATLRGRGPHVRPLYRGPRHRHVLYRASP